MQLIKNIFIPKDNSFQRIKIFIVLILFNIITICQTQNLPRQEVLQTISKATRFMDEKVSLNGGYVWYYKTDLSRMWGEMEAYPSMSWVQGAGIVSMGNLFLDIYKETKDEYYYKLAEKSVNALIRGQLKCGGWHYMIDYAGEESIKKWYNTIGKSGWRLEEFREYLGNATFDDDATEGAASLLLRMYLTKNDKKIKPALDRTINFILKSQYANGGWPQRSPRANIEYKGSPFSYTNDITFNDGVTWNNIKFLIKCYSIFHDKKYIDPIKKGMNIFMLTQQDNPQAAWSQQYTMDLKPDSARSYETRCLDPQYTVHHLEILMKFYEMTGDKKFISRIQDGIDWIKSVVLSHLGDQGDVVVPKFVQIGTNKALYLHRTGENTKFGKYFVNYDANNTVVHYRSTRFLKLGTLEKEFEEIKQKNISQPNGKPYNLPLIGSKENPTSNLEALDEYLSIDSDSWRGIENNEESSIKKIIADLDEQGRWLTKEVSISNPYIGEPTSGDNLSLKYVTTQVGNLYDTSPFKNKTDEKFVSTEEYINNVTKLLNFLKK